MLYQLPNGKVVDLDIEDILSMNQETMQLLLACDAGIHINHPFHKSDSKRLTEQAEDTDNDNPKDYYKDYFPDQYEDDEDPPNINTDII